MKIILKNRLAELLRKRRIRSASEFGRRMVEAGYPMSSSHATRFEKDDPPATDIRFVTAACNVLQCMPSDLYEITIEVEPGETIDPVTLVPPAHAVVIKGGIIQHQTLPTPAETPSEPEATAALPTTSGPRSKSPTSKNAPNKTTGPSGNIFPYIPHKKS